MAKGMKRAFVTPLNIVADSDLEGVGVRRIEGDDEYIFAKGVASVVEGSIVTLNESYVTARLTTALGAVPRRLAVAKAAIVADKYGWFQVRGVGNVMGVTSCAANVALYTDVSNDGMVDDTATDEHAIRDLVLTTAVGGGGNALAPCLMNYPWTVPQLD